MVEHRNPNLDMLRIAVEYLEPLLDQIALLGGAATGLLITDPGAAPVRATLDVDIIVEIRSYPEYRELEERLRQLGFKECPEQNIICRWQRDRLVLDVMPTDQNVLGFGNRWYGPALTHAEWISIGEKDVRVITPPYFLATKIEAFHGRGHGDYLGSRDIEDIVTLVDGRPELPGEVEGSDSMLKDYLRTEIAKLLDHRDFIEAIPGHLLPDKESQQRRDLVLDRLLQMTRNPE